MQYKIGGTNAQTGRAWEVTILAKNAEDAAAQARFYRQSPVLVSDAAPAVEERRTRPARISYLLPLLGAPLIGVALLVKSMLLCANSVRRMIIS